MAGKPIQTYNRTWLGGANSLVPPDAIAQSQYAWAINCVNRGGLVQTRPGFAFLYGIQGKKLQGATIFTPKNSRPQMLVAVDGLIYTAKFPFKTFVQVEGLKFRADAQFINFQPVVKSVDSNEDGSIEILPSSVFFVVIQDGETNPGYFDGITAKHFEPDLKQVPIGLWMSFTASRLWVFSGTRAYVSDLASPDTFFENTYIAERSNFELPGEITGAIESADQNALLVFTRTTTTAFQANIRDRAQWATTPDFQKVILPSIGCVAGRSPVNQYGLTWWMSQAGFINLDAALQSRVTSKLVTVDGRMMRSKRVLSPDLSGCCSTYFENYLLCSVPAGGRYNEETWVGDQSPEGEAMNDSLCWVGVWTGVRPVQWMRTSFGGRERLYFVGFDSTAKDGTQIHVWEAFRDDRKDNSGRISCQWETGMIYGQDLSRFQYAEIDIIEILEDVEVEVFVGGQMGEWHSVAQTTLQAEVGSLGSSNQRRIFKDSVLQAYKPQSRFIKTTQFSSTGKPCGVESDDSPGKDKGFQLLIEWRGRMGVKAINLVTTPDPDAARGQCEKSELGEHNIVTEAGETL